ncbi:MAG: RecQ family zinc-binding domain-containing protein, partial [Bacteroidota bacterium]|nr:RecQ family zinc-binding domain-containing protein [Bacteroidota bacterium]
YHSLSNYFQVPVGSGEGQTFGFDLREFSTRYSLSSTIVYQSLKRLEEAGYIALTESVFIPSRFKIVVDHYDLYAFEIAQRKFEPLLKALLRSYGGCFDEFVSLNETELARRAGMPVKEALDQLRELTRLELIDYKSQTNTPQLTFTSQRMAVENLSIDWKYLNTRKAVFKDKIESMISYAFATGRCRSRILMAYFGEELTGDCGHCDYCLKKDEDSKREIIIHQLKQTLSSGPKVISLVLKDVGIASEKKVLEAVRYMVDSGELEWRSSSELELRK